MAVRILDLQLIYGVAGARDKFQELCQALIQAEFPNAKSVRCDQGDGGVDIYIGDWTASEGIEVFQVKYFPTGLGESQKGQIRESFKRCINNPNFRTKKWTLCVPIELSEEETIWFTRWKQRQATDVLTSDNIGWWGETQFIRLLSKPDNEGIKEDYFQQQHLTQIREMHGMLTNLLDAFDIRWAESVRTVVNWQDTKEANLRRKNDVYTPLYAEIKRLREYTDQARLGNKPYLQWIDVHGERRPLTFPPNYEGPTFHLWPIFKTDIREKDFTPSTHTLLDEVQDLAVFYNTAVTASRLPTSPILKPHIDAAIEAVVQSPSYQEWRQNNTNQVPAMHQGDSEEGLFQSITMGITHTISSHPLGLVWANGWIESWPIHQPATLGWLLARRPDQAASCVYAGCTLFGSPCPPLSWYQGIFAAAWPEMKSLPEYHTVWEVHDRLFEILSKTEAVLLQGLTQIQELYEGGAPLI